MQQPIIEMHGIVKRYYIGKPNELEILHGIDLTVHHGEFVAIVGESGSGKSTLMNIIGVLDKPTEGSYVLDGVDVSKAKDSALSDIRNRKLGLCSRPLTSSDAPAPRKTWSCPCSTPGCPPVSGQSGRRSCWSRWA